LLLNSVSPANTSWSWVNGYPGTLGSELTTNGTFDTDTDWSKGIGWSIGSGVATKTSGTADLLSQAITVTPGNIYLVSFTTTVSSGTITPQFRGGVTVSGAASNSSGTFTRYLIPSAGTNTFSFLANSAFAGTVDNVSVQEVTADSVTAPDGTSTASTFTADVANATFTQSVTAVAADYTFSVYLRRVTGTGDIDITAHSGGTWVTQTITSSWARYTVTQTLTAGARTPGIRIVTSGDQVEVWGAQLEQRSAASAYNVTTTQPITNYIPVLETAASGVARFDHNPTTFESLGLLVEEQRTNLITYSEQFDNAAWAKTNLTVAANQIIAPDGTLTSDKLVATTTNALHIVESSAASLTSGVAYTASVYAKKGETSFLQISFSSAAIPRRANFDLNAGAVGTTDAGITAQIINVGNGWYRCIATGTSDATGSYKAVFALIPSSTSARFASYAGNDFDGLYIWGAQLEAGAYPTSYIPTTTAQVTRAADSASMTGTNFSSWYRQDEGTLFVESASPIAEPSRFGVSDETTSNRILVFSAGIVTTNGTIQAILSSGSEVLNQFQKLALAYETNDFAFTRNGGVVNTDTLGVLPVVNRAGIGQTSNGTVQTQYIKRIAYYPIRLSNTNLQALTG
jgi:hypothetical protein